jgi:flagellar basal body-associated protein FliL
MTFHDGIFIGILLVLGAMAIFVAGVWVGAKAQAIINTRKPKGD